VGGFVVWRGVGKPQVYDRNDASERWREGRNHLGAVGVLWWGWGGVTARRSC